MRIINVAKNTTCSLVAMLVPEECFWSEKTRKNMNFLRFTNVMNLVLKSSSDIYERNSIHFSFCSKSWWGKFYEFLCWVFQTWTRFRFEDSSFFYRNVCNSVPKLIWPRMDSYWSFCLIVPCFAAVISAYPEVCKKRSILFLFCWHEVSPVINLGFFWSDLWMCPTF